MPAASPRQSHCKGEGGEHCSIPISGQFAKLTSKEDGLIPPFWPMAAAPRLHPWGQGAGQEGESRPTAGDTSPAPGEHEGGHGELGPAEHHDVGVGTLHYSQV